MRDFFIRGLEMVINVIVVLFAIVIVLAAGATAFGAGSGMTGPGGMPIAGGPIAGLMILVGGFIYLLLVGGFMYLGLGIYQNTKRTAEALERQSRA